METTSSWRMIVEEVFNKRNTPPSQRRPHGHVKTGVTKKGNKKRGLRARAVSLLDDEMAEAEEDEDGGALDSGRPPALTGRFSLCSKMGKGGQQSARVKLGDRC